MFIALVGVTMYISLMGLLFVYTHDQDLRKYWPLVLFWPLTLAALPAWVIYRVIDRVHDPERKLIRQISVMAKKKRILELEKELEQSEQVYLKSLGEI
jgi:hypothetical protein